VPELREVVIVDAVRPIGRRHEQKGYYKDIHPATLLGRTYSELIARTAIDPVEVEIAIAGCVNQFGEQGLNIARNAWLQEGLPIETAATTIDLQCGSAQRAINFGAAQIASGVFDVVIASGIEYMGHISFADVDAVNAQHDHPFTPELLERYQNRRPGARRGDDR
jgi:acetyl-CoA acetyltransferase